METTAACITWSFKWPEFDRIATPALAVPAARIAHRIAIIGSSGAVALIRPANAPAFPNRRGDGLRIVARKLNAATLPIVLRLPGSATEETEESNSTKQSNEESTA
ncbi:MAG TPA: hypothetical protein VGY55_22015 [Pirellulales bacterium]|jgi:hypothetical protein|nr:hypothetical protein [Pirellulales bacterium]